MYSTLDMSSASRAQVERLVRQVRDPIQKLGHARKKKRVSEATSFARLYAFTRFLKVLVGVYGYQFRTVDSLGEKHFRKYADHLLKKGYSPGRLANVHSHLSTIYRHVLRKPCIDSPQTYFGDHVRRSHVADHSKAWDDQELVDEQGARIDAKTIRQRIADRCAGTGLLTELTHALGLRAKEALFFRPHEDWLNDTTVRVREQGSKGGRERVLDLSTFSEAMRAEAIDVLTRCREYVTNPVGTVLEPHRTGQRWITRMRHVYWIIRQEGVAKNLLGITLHGLRHGFLQRFKLATSGTPAPVHGLLSPEQVSDVRQVAIDAVTRALAAETAGHSRTSVTNSYYGSPSTQWRDSGGSPELWATGKRFLADIEKGEVDALRQRLEALRSPATDVQALLQETERRAAITRIRYRYRQ
jgi:integrase